MSTAFNCYTVYPKIYTHGFCFAVLCCGYTLTDFPISIRLTSLALWQSNDCPSASKATVMNMDKYFMWIHYERLHNHNKAKHNKTVCIFLGIYSMAYHDMHYNRMYSHFVDVKDITYLNCQLLIDISISDFRFAYANASECSLTNSWKWMSSFKFAGTWLLVG